MNYSFKSYLKERLENRKAWSDYFLYCLMHWEINDKVSGEYYKDKPLLSITLKLYYLPINIIKSFSKIRAWHYYLKTQTDFEHNFGLDPNNKGLAIGKMFGVLVVKNQQNKIGYITAVSGTLAEREMGR